jgi:hypothetical protein
MPKSCIAYIGGVFGSVGSASSGSVATGFSRTDTSSTAAAAGNSQDSGAPTTGGVRVFVNLTALSGTSPTIAFALWDSADNVTFAAVPGATIAAMNAVGTGSVSVPAGQLVRRYRAIVTTVTGTTPSATFNANVADGNVAFTPHQNPDHTAVKDTRT